MTDYLILGLATWRIANLLVNEDGPWDILLKLRYAAGTRYDQQSQPYPTNVFSGLLICVWCLSPWVGGIFTLGYLFNPTVTIWISLPFALSAMAVAVDRWING